MKIALAVFAVLLGATDPAACQFGGNDRPDDPATLSVTWFVEGQPPAMTVTQMSSLKACVLAKALAEQAGDEVRRERIRLNEQDKADVMAGRVSRVGEKGNWIAPAGVYAVGKPMPPKRWVIFELSPEAQRKLKGVTLPYLSAYCVQP